MTSNTHDSQRGRNLGPFDARFTRSATGKMPGNVMGTRRRTPSLAIRAQRLGRASNSSPLVCHRGKHVVEMVPGHRREVINVIWLLQVDGAVFSEVGFATPETWRPQVWGATFSNAGFALLFAPLAGMARRGAQPVCHILYCGQCVSSSAEMPSPFLPLPHSCHLKRESVCVSVCACCAANAETLEAFLQSGD